jgi:ribosomal-protein-alanine N-acetyltransferase
MKLVGKKIYLRPITIGDASIEYVNWLNDKEVNQYLESRFVLATIENVRKFIESVLVSNNNYFFAIIDVETDKHIGNIKLGPINTFHKRGDIGILIGDKNYWGKGIGTEAIFLISEFAFNNLNLDKVMAGCYANNIGSYKSFFKCGFVEEGLFKNHCISATGEVVDVYMLAKFKTKVE